jgi:hypothetical protein
LADRLRIIVSGMLAGDPHQGGASWAVLQYLLGLQQLGHDVTFIEPIRTAQLNAASHISHSGSAPPPRRQDLARSASAKYFNSVVTQFGLRDNSALIAVEPERAVGLSYDALRRRCNDADLLLNISGLLRDPILLDPIPTRVFLDLDPAFNQVWASQGIDMGFDLHTHFVTIGQKLGDSGCPVPLGQKMAESDCPVPLNKPEWIKTLPLVVLDHWPVVTDPPRFGFTTVGNWRSYGTVELAGERYGLKAHSLRQFWSLAQRAGARFELALAVHPQESNDLAAFTEYGWHLLDPAELVSDPDSYHNFIGSSQAEFGIAKEGYVKSRCGWFSDRSVCYLASGRPVLAQETGFSDTIPTGDGLLTFGDLDDAIAGVQELDRDYQRHCLAAREIAETYFDSRKVLTRLLEEVAK